MISVVTGAYGLGGANLVRSLLGRGDQVRAADKVQTESLAGLDVEHIDIDVLKPDSLHALEFSPSASHHKATAEFGYNPRPFTETVRDTFDWFDQHNDQADSA